MDLLNVIYLLLIIILGLIAAAVIQIKLVGIGIKDFWQFIEANQLLDKLYAFSTTYQTLSAQEQVVFLSEAEKIFSAFDRVPNVLWEEEYQKYIEVLDKYKDIRIIRWNSDC